MILIDTWRFLWYNRRMKQGDETMLPRNQAAYVLILIGKTLENPAAVARLEKEIGSYGIKELHAAEIALADAHQLEVWRPGK